MKGVEGKEEKNGKSSINARGPEEDLMAASNMRSPGSVCIAVSLIGWFPP